MELKHPNAEEGLTIQFKLLQDCVEFDFSKTTAHGWRVLPQVKPARVRKFLFNKH